MNTTPTLDLSVKLHCPNWLHQMVKAGPGLFDIDEPGMAGISGGETSGLMRALIAWFARNPEGVYCGFRNTGLEHSQTYLFLQMLGAAGLHMEWTEYRKPLVAGGAPSTSRFEVVTPATASRNGEPFSALLEALAEYRSAVKGLGPVRPSPAMRLCSAYLKNKVADAIAKSRGYETYTTFLGLRADEPERVAKMRARDTRSKTSRAPLAELGITKELVHRFWREQPFRLMLPENLGNCDLCFLKDEGDLAHNMAYELPEERTRWWIDIQKKYGDFHARSYEELLAEAEARASIRDGLIGGLLPVRPAHITERRFQLLIRQEKRRLEKKIQRMPCNCEASELLTDEHLFQIQGAA